MNEDIHVLIDGLQRVRDELNKPDPDEVIARLRRDRQDAAAMLRRVEWSGKHVRYDAMTDDICPVCDAFPPDHAPDCSLAALLKRLEG